MEADDINWDTIVEVLPSGSGEEYEERIKYDIIVSNILENGGAVIKICV